VPSKTMLKPAVHSAIDRIQEHEALMNVILYLTHPLQYASSKDARAKIILSGPDHRVAEHLKTWNSLFSGMSWMINRQTPSHRDGSGYTAGFDFLSVAGVASSVLELPDLGLKLSYERGCVVGLAGKALSHEVASWMGGDRICCARWIRQQVFQDLNAVGVDWPTVAVIGKLLMM